MWNIKYEKRVQKDLTKLKHANLSKNAARMIEILKSDPFSPKFEKLIGDMDGLFSRRISLKHRLIYRVSKKEQTIFVISMWSHYGE